MQSADQLQLVRREAVQVQGTTLPQNLIRHTPRKQVSGFYQPLSLASSLSAVLVSIQNCKWATIMRKR